MVSIVSNLSSSDWTNVSRTVSSLEAPHFSPSPTSSSVTIPAKTSPTGSSHKVRGRGQALKSSRRRGIGVGTVLFARWIDNARLRNQQEIKIKTGVSSDVCTYLA